MNGLLVHNRFWKVVQLNCAKVVFGICEGFVELITEIVYAFNQITATNYRSL